MVNDGRICRNLALRMHFGSNQYTHHIRLSKTEDLQMKRLLTLGLVLAALATFGTATEAGWRGRGRHGCYGNGASHISHQIRNRYLSGSYHFGFHNYTYPRVHSTWHDTSHYDYHPGEYVPHGNHYDYVPGHWDYHRTGHWDTHHHH